MAAPTRIDELKKRYEENQRRFFAPLANEYRKAGDLDQAIALCRMHLAEAPNNISGQIVFAQALYDAGTLDESRTVFETAIGLDPENLIALRHLGDIARTQRDIPTARQWYQRVLDADRRNEEVLALMAELDTLESAPPEPGAETAVDSPAPEPAAEPADGGAAPYMARSPVSSSASLTGSAPGAGSDTPTVEIVAMKAPAPEVAEPEQPVPPPAPGPAAVDEIGFEPAEPAIESHASHNSPDSSFGFDVDLDAAAHIPSYTEESTSEFGVVELPVVSAFSDVEPESAPAQAEPVEMAYDATVEATLEGAADSAGEPPEIPAEMTVEAPAESGVGITVELPVDVSAEEQTAIDAPTVEMPSVLEYIEEAPAAAPEVPPAEELLDFELETPPAPEPVSEAAFEAFELTTSAPEFVAEPAVSEEPAPARRAALESFDPIREMPTPIAPMAAARSSTPLQWMPPIVDEAPAEIAQTEPQAPQEAFATETMAELYVQQGLRQEAIGVYQQLIAARPDDAGLRARLAELTGASRKPGGSTARAFFANLAGRRATPLRTSVVVEPPVMRTPTPGSQPAVEPVVEPVLEPAVEVPAESAHESIVQPAIEAAPESMPDPVASSANESATDVATEEVPTSDASAGGTLDALFGHSGVATPDNSAAHALAAAFGSTPTPPSGRPTRAASDEFSLDRVFREGTSTPSKGGLAVPRQSSSLRFDQFFTPPADSPGNPPTTKPAADAGGESEQFQSWLSGLKKP